MVCSYSDETALSEVSRRITNKSSELNLSSAFIVEGFSRTGLELRECFQVCDPLCKIKVKRALQSWLPSVQEEIKGKNIDEMEEEIKLIQIMSVSKWKTK